MPLASGSRLGVYEIVSLIGAGGMGEVYRARDTRLDRAVAIKVLPSDMASATALRERFVREARTVAALNHPHICVIYDVGRQDPSTGSGQAVDFLVMEYLEGETLEERLKRGALPLEHALHVAIQVADALAAAHRAGVIHRLPFDLDRLQVSGEPVRLGDAVLGGVEGAQYAVSDVGELVYLPGSSQRRERRLVWVDRSGRVQALAAPPREYANTVISPDGGLAAVNIQGGRDDIWICDFARATLTQPFPGPGGRLQISIAGGTEPVWSRDGRELFYVDGERMMAVEITTTPAFRAGAPRLLFEGRYLRSPNAVAGYDVTSDGQRFLFVQPMHPDPLANQIHVVLNWFEELRRLVPAP